MNVQEIRQAYLDFCQKHDHVVIPRAPLVLKDDPTTLFTGSGMQPLLPYLLGKPHPSGKRLADSQTCLRAQDIDDVGDNRHTTFFEMLGNWSLGDYFKRQQITWFFEFLTEVVGLDPAKIYVTCFIGDDKHGIPRDEESAQVWQELFTAAGVDAEIVDLGSAENGNQQGMQGGRIFFYDDGENWWSRGGDIEGTPVGDPCGPDSEVFYDFGEEFHDSSFGLPHPASDSGRFMEIGNQVFMEYKRLEDGKFEPLANKNVDFGGGLERIAAAKLGNPDVFMIDSIKPLIDALERLSGRSYTDHQTSMRVIADHVRAATWLAIDGCTPSNKEQGYVMRRLVRRAIRHGMDLGLENEDYRELIEIVLNSYQDFYPEIIDQRDQITNIIMQEAKAFSKTITKGIRYLIRFMESGLTGQELFTLYDTHGFPIELGVEVAKSHGIELEEDWQKNFDLCMEEQRKRSQTASKGKFKGGLAGETPKQLRLHTSAHLMLAAMKRVLGEEVNQKGSNITDERLRFDFNYPEKVSRDKLDEIEKLVNQAIADKLPVSFEEMTIEQAKELGAHGDFMDRYGDKVKVYQVGEGDQRFSYEICGGPHVGNTAEIAPNGEKFKIVKEGSSSAGVRRVRAILE